MSDALQALREVDFEWTTRLDGVWQDLPYDVPEFQESVRDDALAKLERLFVGKSSASPLGLLLVGPGGSGKTHMLSSLRQTALERGAFFVLVDMTDVHDFWETTLLGYIRSLAQKHRDGLPQQELLLKALIERAGTKVTVEQLVQGRPPRLINLCEVFIHGLMHGGAALQEHQDVLRALILLGSNDVNMRDLGWKWLQAVGLEENEKVLFGFHRPRGVPREIVQGLSCLMSLAAPTVLALDQLDAIVAEQQLLAYLENDPEQNARGAAALAIIQGIAGGLLALRDSTSRTQTVVSCLEQTWSILEKRVQISVRDRFFPPILLKPALGNNLAQALVERRLAAAYRECGFQPAYPSYPYKPELFAQLRGLSPREVLKRCDEHRWECLRTRTVSELASTTQPSGSTRPRRRPNFRTRYDELAASTEPSKIIEDADEAVLDALLETACKALVIENPVPDNVDAFVETEFTQQGKYVPLHARLRLVYRAQSERERHFAVRFLQDSNAIAFQARLKAAMTLSGIDHMLEFRRLVLFRSGPVPSGKATASLMEEFHQRGGIICQPTHDELRALTALQSLLKAEDRADVESWLRQERIASQLPAFRSVTEYLFSDLATRSVAPAKSTRPAVGDGQHARESGGDALTPKPEAVIETSSADAIFVGNKLVAGAPKEPLDIPIENLVKHTVILAGAGSGKTVLVRRIVEEAVLAGIPAIVLDGANDLSRLGDPWPEAPAEFDAIDKQKAERYRQSADVVIWTPGRESGNPLFLEPLPDFSDVADNADDLQAALDMARSSLQPLVGGTGRGADKKLGVLAGALRYFAKLGGGSLREFVSLLSDLPADANAGFEKADKIARDMGESILAALETNPLLRGSGTPLDLERLLRSRDPLKVRVSVINLSGLPDATAQQQFVNQLATTLFTWIKKHPPRDRKVSGLLVIDEARDFVPSGKSVPGKDNLIRLAAQARKYGLGIVFATQAPKSIDHNVIANCSTQFYGRANSPAAIDTVQAQLQERGGGGNDIAKLPKGTFYVFTEGLKAPMKIATRLCLSHHPASPPQESEIVRRAAECRKKLGAP